VTTNRRRLEPVPDPVTSLFNARRRHPSRGTMSDSTPITTTVIEADSVEVTAAARPPEPAPEPEPEQPEIPDQPERDPDPDNPLNRPEPEPE